MTDPEQSIDRLERNAERTREDLSHTVDELRTRISDTATDLRTRVSPAAIKEEVKDYVKASGQHLFHTLQRKARENPLQAVAVAAGFAYPLWRIVSNMPAPVLLIGAGIALSSQSGKQGAGGPSAAHRGRFGHADADGLGRGAGDISATVRNATTEVAGRIGDAAEKVQSVISSAADQVTKGIGQTVTGVKDMANAATTGFEALSEGLSSSYEKGMEAASYVQQQAIRAGEQTREALVESIERHPFLIGGVGLAIGALIAAAIPPSSPERRLFGESSDELQRRARDMASQGLEAARALAGEVYEDTVGVAKEVGVGDLGKKVKAVAERATNVVTSAVEPDSPGRARDKNQT